MTRPTAGCLWLTGAFLLVLLLKLYLAARLDLYSDEIFYWWAGTRLAPAYSDLPFMAALLAGIGSGFGPADALSVRSPFLLLGSALPALVYWLARPVTNHRQALESAALTLCLPLAGFMGLLAVPDVPLVFFGLLTIGFLQRALRTDQLRYWLATGCTMALGLSTHYRFLLYPLAALLLLLWFADARRCWCNGKFWLAVMIASLGLVPMVWFNLHNQLAGASFHLLERHPWTFQPAGMLHLFKQAVLVTPPLYILFILTLITLWRQARQQQQDAALLLTFAVVNLAVYLLLAPWTDTASTSVHWPLSGYLPLLVAAPPTLRKLRARCAIRWDRRRAQRGLLAIPAIGFSGTLIALLGVGSQGFPQQLQPLVGGEILSSKMAGWKPFAAHTAALLAHHYASTEPVLVTDNYYTAAQLEFAGITTRTLTLDQHKALRDGRIAQLRLWGKDASRLAQYAGYPALYITEDSTLTVDQKTALMTRICSHAGMIAPLSRLSLFGGNKTFSYYRVSRLTPRSDVPAFPCPYPMQAWIEFPAAGTTLSGTVKLSGWAYSEDIGIAGVDILLDGERVATADYGSRRMDVVQIKGVRTDPGRPDLGFNYLLDTQQFPNGHHRLALELVNRAGSRMLYGERTIKIVN